MGLLDFISGDKDDKNDANNAPVAPSLQPAANVTPGISPVDPAASTTTQSVTDTTAPTDSEMMPAANPAPGLRSVPQDAPSINTSIQNNTVNDYGTENLTGSAPTPMSEMQSSMPSGNPSNPMPIPEYVQPTEVNTADIQQKSSDPYSQNAVDQMNDPAQSATEQPNILATPEAPANTNELPNISVPEAIPAESAETQIQPEVQPESMTEPQEVTVIPEPTGDAAISQTSEPTTISELQNSVPTEDTAIGTDSDLNSPQTISEIIDKKSEEDNNPEEVAAENTSNVLDINTNKNIEASTNVSIDKETKMLFSKIGLIGLKKSNIDTIEFKNVTKTLLGKKYSLILDSAEGLGKSAVEAAKESSSKVTTVYLKSFLNQDEEQANSSDAEISVIYSNYLEKLKHFIKESRVFVFFSLSDIEVLSMFSTVLDLQKIYKNSSKPIVCVGDEWNSIIEQIATLTELTAEDKKNIRVISSINDFDQSLTDIQNQYSSNKNDINMPKVVDRRVEGDEKDLVLY